MWKTKADIRGLYSLYTNICRKSSRQALFRDLGDVKRVLGSFTHRASVPGVRLTPEGVASMMLRIGSVQFASVYSVSFDIVNSIRA